MKRDYIALDLLVLLIRLVSSWQATIPHGYSFKVILESRPPQYTSVCALSQEWTRAASTKGIDGTWHCPMVI